MNFDPKPPMSDREYLEMIYSLLTEMNGAWLSQVRSLNNTVAKILLNIVDLQNTLGLLHNGLKETRDKRYQEEIDGLEDQMRNLKKQLEEKRVARSAPLSTSQEIRSIALDVVTEQRQAEQKRKAVDWIDVRNKTLLVVAGGVVWALIQYGLPALGRILIEIFSK